MRKIVGLLVVLALILSFSATVFAAPVPVKNMNNVSVEGEGLTFSYKARTAGVLSITISGDPGYRVTVSAIKTGDIVGLPESGDTEQTFTFSLEAATSYNIQISGFDKSTWDVAAATVSFNVTFDDAVVEEVEPVEIDKSDVNLELGENNVSLLENTLISLFAFTPAEPGVYTFTANGAEIGSYGFATWSLMEAGENGVLVHTATAAEQTLLIGLSAATPNVNVKVEKTGDYTPPVQIQYEEYIPVNNALTSFVEPDGMESIDITQEQNVVLGDDGYYHLGTVDGPIVYVNLNTDQFTLAILYSAGAPIHMRGVYTDENGDPHYYDFMSMITSQYYEYSQENDYHPLNTDLLIFLKAYGTSQGWYNVGTSAFESITSGDFVEESAWLAGCYIAPNAAPEIPEPTNPTEPSTPATEPSAPATEPSAPATEPSAPATEPSAPATEPSAPATEPSAPATEPEATEPEATEPDGDEPNDEPTADLDMTEVEATLEIIDSLDLGAYTEESMLALTEALEAYYAVLNDPNVTQEMIDQANATLLSAIENLVEVDENESTEPETPNEDDNTGAEDDDDEVPKTGCVGIIGAAVAMAFSAMGGVAIIKKKEF